MGSKKYRSKSEQKTPGEKGTKNQLSLVDIDSWRLKKPTRSLQASIPDPLCICYGCLLIGDFLGDLIVGKHVLGVSVCTCDSFPPSGLSCLALV